MVTAKRLMAILSVAVVLAISHLGASVGTAPAWAGDVGFIEDFSLAKDRAVALKQRN